MNATTLLQIGRRIAAERLRQGMTQAELSIKCDLSLKTISMLETGQRELRVGSLTRLCNVLHVSADYLLFGLSLDEDAISIKHDLERMNPIVARQEIWQNGTR